MRAAPSDAWERPIEAARAPLRLPPFNISKSLLCSRTHHPFPSDSYILPPTMGGMKISDCQCQSFVDDVAQLPVNFLEMFGFSTMDTFAYIFAYIKSIQMCSIYSLIYGTGPSSWKNTCWANERLVFGGGGLGVVWGWLSNRSRNGVAIADGRMTCRAQRKCPGIKYIAMMK